MILKFKLIIQSKPKDYHNLENLSESVCWDFVRKLIKFQMKLTVVFIITGMFRTVSRKCGMLIKTKIIPDNVITETS